MRRSLKLALRIGLPLLLAVFFLSNSHKIFYSSKQSDISYAREASERPFQAKDNRPDFVHLAKKLSPAVVNISTSAR